jgi:nucleotide-binding universal stress UspA family protein
MGRPVPDAAAQSLGCNLLVKGAYTQSRLRQMIFGGTTRHILGHATLPVIMANLTESEGRSRFYLRIM